MNTYPEYFWSKPITRSLLSLAERYKEIILDKDNKENESLNSNIFIDFFTDPQVDNIHFVIQVRELLIIEEIPLDIWMSTI